MRENQKRVRLRSTFHEKKVKILVSVLKASKSQGFAIGAVVLTMKSLQAEHQLPLHTCEKCKFLGPTQTLGSDAGGGAEHLWLNKPSRCL